MVPTKSPVTSSGATKRLSSARNIPPRSISTPMKNIPQLHTTSQSAKPSPRLNSILLPTQLESNINVYVRCRSRNEREIKENSGVVVSTLGQDGKEVMIQTNQTSAINKTYTFDSVFGAESDQELIFQTVAQNSLNEMLQGYNCTIFAYGQTGTGKTYTMSGDISTTSNTLGSHAGIIPRTLVQLFKSLKEENAENAVRVSFIELYNEELKDLLVPDECERKVRIYDDHGKKSIVVQGMEEVFIQNATDGLKLLEQGSFKRQVAATHCNDLSSRSHTVFTITVHMKKIDPVSGEEYVKVGKLNLVDLAGSENINRSGAENKRAREAGMINQSLLTLGRVINCLVDKSPHIPYRESKLTRILQDSLGGQTKTCIIATISPAKVSLEETISTLEYASRAKNIKNKPLVNQSRSKQLLFGEYINEIERLRKDLAATREQSGGVYMTLENHQKLMEETQSRKLLIEEQKLKIDMLEDQNKRFKESYEEQLDECKLAKEQVSGLEMSLMETKDLLQYMEQCAVEFENKYQDETIVREELERNQEQSQSYYKTLVYIMKEVLLTRDKLEDVLQENINTFACNDKLLAKRKEQVATLIDEDLQESISELSSQYETSLKQLSSNFEVVIHNHQDYLLQKINQIEQNKDKLSGGADETNSQIFGELSNMNTSILEFFKDLVSKHREICSVELPQLQEKLFQKLDSHTALISKSENDIQDSHHSIGQKFKTTFQLIESQFLVQLEELMRLTAVSKERSEKSIKSLEETMMTRQMMHEDEIHAQEEELNLLINKMTDLINEVKSQRQSRTQKTFNLGQNSLSSLKEDSINFHNLHYLNIGKLVESEKIFSEAITSGRDDLKSSIILSHESSKKIFASMKDNVNELCDLQATNFDRVTNNIKLHCDVNELKGIELNNSIKTHSEKINHSLNHLKSETISSLESLASNFSEFQNSLNNIKPSIIDSYTQDQTRLLSSYHSSSLERIESLKNFVTSIELSKPDNVLPVLKKYEYPLNLPQTKNRDELLRFKKRKTCVSRPKEETCDSMAMNDLENLTPLPVPIPDAPMVENTTPSSMMKVKHIKNINRVRFGGTGSSSKSLKPKPLQELNL